MATADVPLAADVMELVESANGSVVGATTPDFLNTLAADDPNTALSFGAEDIHPSAASGEVLYQRTDSQGVTMRTTNTSRLKINENGKPVEQPFVRLWRLDTKQYVRAPRTQVIDCLNKRNDAGEKVFALRGEVNPTEKPYLCMFKDDVQCPARFVRRSEMLNHAKRRHPSLWDAIAAENDNLQVEQQKAMILALQQQGAAMQSMMEQQSRALTIALDRLGTAGVTAPPEVVAVAKGESRPDIAAPDVKKKPTRYIDLADRESVTIPN